MLLSSEQSVEGQLASLLINNALTMISGWISDLTKHVVKDYEGIENLMDEGNTNR